MLASKKSDQLPDYRLYVTVFMLLFLNPLAIFPSDKNDIEIDYVNGALNGDTYTIDARILYDFSAESREALDHGVALQIDIELRVKMRRQWFWDKTITSTVLSYQLEYQPLSGHYLVTNLNDSNRRQFQQLESVLNFLGTVKGFPLVKRELLLSGNAYIAQIRARLNIQALPAPLRPLAYVSSKWRRLNSSWHDWIIQL